MSKTWYGHHIETIKGEDYVLFKDYLELEKLCDKYEEEHKTTFKIWQKDIKIIDELEKYLKEQVFNKAGNSVDLAIENHSYCKVLDKLNELKGE